MRVARFVLAFLPATFLGQGQNAVPALDVASLKPSERLAPGQNYNANLGSIQNETLTLTNATMADFVKFAYGLVKLGLRLENRKDAMEVLVVDHADQTRVAN
jgi:hypothetical protein